MGRKNSKCFVVGETYRRRICRIYAGGIWIFLGPALGLGSGFIGGHGNVPRKKESCH